MRVAPSTPVTCFSKCEAASKIKLTRADTGMHAHPVNILRRKQMSVSGFWHGSSEGRNPGVAPYRVGLAPLGTSVWGATGVSVYFILAGTSGSVR